MIRGRQQRNGSLFVYVSIGVGIPANHPLRLRDRHRLEGGSAFLFSCANRLGRLDLSNRRVEVLPAGTITTGRADGRLLVIGTPTLSGEDSDLPDGTYLSADGQTSVIVRANDLDVRSANGALLTGSNYAKNMVHGKADSFMVSSATTMAHSIPTGSATLALE